MSKITRTQWVGVAGAIAVVIGSVLPWVTVQSVFGQLEVAGTDGDGKITLALGIGAALILLFTRLWWVSMLLSIGAGAVYAYDWGNLSDKISDTDFDGMAHASVGTGIYVGVVGAIVAAIAALCCRSEHKRSLPPPTNDEVRHRLGVEQSRPTGKTDT